MNATVRLLAILIAGGIALALVPDGVRERMQADGRLTTADGDTVEITDAARADGLRFTAAVAPADRAWIEAATARARPEAARLIAEVDGLVQVGADVGAEGALGVTRSGPRGFVIDLALVPAAVNASLDAQVPRGGPCGLAIDCDLPEERFADTFAKWALNGAVSEVGAGYGIAMPASIENWGAPLAAIALGLPAG